MAGFSYTQNRELSWLKFNERVLEEAYADEVPLYERLKFIAIFTSNLDEFFMVRVGSLYDMSLDGDDQIDNKTGLSPSQQLERIYHAVEPLYKKRDRYFREVENALRAYGIADYEHRRTQGRRRRVRLRLLALLRAAGAVAADRGRSPSLPLRGQQGAPCGGGAAKEKAHHHGPDPHARGAARAAVSAGARASATCIWRTSSAATPKRPSPPTRCFRAISSASPATPTSAPRTRSSPPPAISARR